MIARIAIEELLSGLQLSAFVLFEGEWRRTGTNESDLLHCFPELKSEPPPLERVFPFLSNFIDDCRGPAPGAARTIRSGPWTQVDSSGQSCNLEAIWIRGADREVLLIEILGRDYQDKLEVLQAARENHLVHEQLVKTEEALREAQRKLEQTNEALEGMVADRTRALVAVNEELKGEVAERKAVNQRLLVQQEQLRSLADELVLAEERERRRIAAGLHDDIGQALAMAKIKLAELANNSGSPEMTAEIQEVKELLEGTIAASRSLTFELASPALYELGLEAAIDDLLGRIRDDHDIRTELVTSGSHTPLSERVKVFLFQAVRELLHNCLKHAAAERILVSLNDYGGTVQITVADDGRGFAEVAESERLGFGLFNVRERLEHLGGDFELLSSAGEGTTVTLRVPRSRVDLEGSRS